MLFSVRRQAVIRKWSGFAGVLLLNFTPCALVGLLFPGAFLYAISLHVIFLGVMLAARYLNRNENLTPSKRAPKLKNKQEKYAQTFLNKLAQKFNRVPPVLLIDKNKETNVQSILSNPGRSISWPYSERIVLSKAVLRLLSQEGCQAMLAHEFAHINNNDTLLTIVINVLSELIEFYFLLSLSFSLVGALLVGVSSLFYSVGFSTMMATMVFPGLILLSSLSLKVIHFMQIALSMVFSRAKESIADLDAAEMIKNPRAMAYVFEEFSLIELKRGVYYSAEGCYLQVEEQKTQKEIKKLFDLIHKETQILKKRDKFIVPGEVFAKHFKRGKPIVLNNEQKNTSLVQACTHHYQKFYFTMFKNDHPTNKQRKADIKAAFPEDYNIRKENGIFKVKKTSH